jgi:hypothetical protein
MESKLIKPWRRFSIKINYLIMGGVKMERQLKKNSAEKHKVVIISILYGSAVIITLSGFYFSIFSLINHISFRVLNASVPGLIFGFLVIYLGLRYLFSVKALKTEVYKKSSRFSWSNFRKENRNKSC